MPQNYKSPPQASFYKNLAQILIFAFIFCACSSNQPQYVDSRDYVSFELDNHDIGDMIEKLIEKLLDNPTIRKQSELKILAIGEIENATNQSHRANRK
ncbi:hypothetical protein [Helicobacter sp. 23-1045]